MHRTSITHPLVVSWVTWAPGPAGPHDAGRLGLAMAPGARCAVPGTSDAWERSLDLDMAALQRAGVTRLVCLLPSAELTLLGLDDYPEVAAAAGLPFWRLAIPVTATPGDGSPDSPSEASLRALVGDVARSLAAGERVVVHCRGGLGRTGLVAGCVLRALGYGPEETLARLAETRGDGCPETEAQRDAILRYAHA